MPGPLVHKAAMRRVNRFLKTSYGGAMTPDMNHRSHGYDIVTKTGTLVECILDAAAKKDPVYLCHYLVDALSVGQINSKYWGKDDDILDILSEFVINKDQGKRALFETNDLRGTVLLLMEETNKLYYCRARNKLLFAFNGLSGMIRRAVRHGADLTVAVMKA